jgi:hypothetical protein
MRNLPGRRQQQNCECNEGEYLNQKALELGQELVLHPGFVSQQRIPRVECYVPRRAACTTPGVYS